MLLQFAKKYDSISNKEVYLKMEYKQKNFRKVRCKKINAFFLVIFFTRISLDIVRNKNPLDLNDFKLKKKIINTIFFLIV